MNKTIEIIKQLETTTGTNDKIKIIKDNANENNFVKSLQYTYTSDLQYGFSDKKLREELNKYIAQNKDKSINTKYKNGFQLLDVLAKSNINDVLRNETYQFLVSCNNDERELWIRIITKDLRCNISAKSINKAIPDTIFVFGVMLADKYFNKQSKVKNKEFIITQKLDGARFILIKDHEGNVKYYTRQGQEVTGLIEFEEDLKKIPNNTVIDGEVLLDKDGLHSKDLYRETMKEFRKKGEKHGLILHAFDILSYDEFRKGVSIDNCKDRKDRLHELITNNEFTNIVEVPVRYIGKDESMIIKLLDEATSKDEEGIMVNISDGVYECKRTTNILKVKKFQDADLKVIDIIEGTGKNQGKLGAITIQFIVDNKIYQCDCGSGFSDEERTLYWKNKELLLNKIVTIGYFEISQNSKTKEYGLRFPTWKGIIRDDKTEISMY